MSEPDVDALRSATAAERGKMLLSWPEDQWFDRKSGRVRPLVTLPRRGRVRERRGRGYRGRLHDGALDRRRFHRGEERAAASGRPTSPSRRQSRSPGGRRWRPAICPARASWLRCGRATACTPTSRTRSTYASATRRASQLRPATRTRVRQGAEQLRADATRGCSAEPNSTPSSR